MEQSYLINNNFIDIFKKNADYHNIFNIIESNFNFYNLENIDIIFLNNYFFSDVINTIKIIITEARMLEDNFYLDYNQYNMNYLKEGEKLVCHMKFILISKNLFDLLLKDI